MSVSGNSCDRGDAYARSEVTSPVRTLTSVVAITGSDKPVVSVKTERAVPKSAIDECLREIKNVKVQSPVSIGDVIIRDVAGTGVNVTATSNA